MEDKKEYLDLTMKVWEKTLASKIIPMEDVPKSIEKILTNYCKRNIKVKDDSLTENTTVNDMIQLKDIRLGDVIEANFGNRIVKGEIVTISSVGFPDNYNYFKDSDKVLHGYIEWTLFPEYITGIDTGFRTYYQWMSDYKGRYKIIKKEDYEDLGK